jgi:hypothetical protein
MEAFKTTLIASVGAFLIGAASAAAGLALTTKVALKSNHVGAAQASGLVTHVARAPGDPDAPPGYSRLGIAKINGRRIAVYAFQNVAKLGDVAGQGRGFADVFDSAGHLVRRFIVRENLNSQPQIIEFVYLPAR